MNLSRRDVLVCLSVANLSLLEAWRRLIFANRYLLPLWTWRDLAAAAFVLLWLTVLFLTLVLARRLPRLRFLHTDRWMFLLPVVVFMNLFRHQFTIRYKQIVQHEHLAAYVVVAVLLAALLFKRYAPQIARGAEVLALCALPFLPLCLAEGAWVLTHEPPRLPIAGRMAVKAGSPRFVWIIFDETDWKYVDPVTRPVSLALPEFDRMMAQSIVVQDAVQSGLQTAGAMPTMIYGQPVEIGLSERSGKLVTANDEHDGIDWAYRPNIFTRARRDGLNTSVDGWYLPYCRIFAHDLSDCYWEAIDTRVKGFEPSFSNSLSSVLRTLSPLEDRQRQLRRFMRLERESLKDAVDPELNLVLLHLPVPHEPAIYDRRSGKLTTLNFHSDWYLDNLALADRTLGDIHRAMEQAGVWDSSTVLVTSDHSLRWYPGWSEHPNPLVPYLLKLPGEHETHLYPTPVHTILTADLIGAVLSGEVRDSSQAISWLDVHVHAHPVFRAATLARQGTSQAH